MQSIKSLFAHKMYTMTIDTRIQLAGQQGSVAVTAIEKKGK